jgi:hypothetical protein
MKREAEDELIRGDIAMAREALKAKRIDLDEVMRAVEADDNSGFCLACGAQADCCEPDARRYVCESCDARAVFGAEEVLIMLA